MTSAAMLLGRGGFRVPPGAFDQEFDGSGLPAGWSVLASSSGTYDVNSTDAGALNMGSGSIGIYRSIPSIPFTVTAFFKRLSLSPGEYCDAGVMLGEATPGKFIHGCMDVTFLGQFSVLGSYWTSPTVWSNNIATAQHDLGVNVAPTHYSRFVVHSQTDVDGWYSADGVTWERWLQAYNPGFTIGSVGLDLHASAPHDVAVDWIRFT